MKGDRRWLVVLALGAVCWAVAGAVNQRLRFTGEDGGWFNYAPDNGVAFSPSSGWIWQELVVWLVAIAIWFVLSARILKAEEN